MRQSVILQYVSISKVVLQKEIAISDKCIVIGYNFNFDVQFVRLVLFIYI